MNQNPYSLSIDIIFNIYSIPTRRIYIKYTKRYSASRQYLFSPFSKTVFKKNGLQMVSPQFKSMPTRIPYSYNGIKYSAIKYVIISIF